MLTIDGQMRERVRGRGSLILTNVIADANAAATRGLAKAKDAKLNIVEAAEWNGRYNGCRYHGEEQQSKGNPKQH